MLVSEDIFFDTDSFHWSFDEFSTIPLSSKCSIMSAITLISYSNWTEAMN